MKKVGIGIIGCGNISSAYLKAMASFPILDVRGLADMNAEVAKARADEFGLQAKSIDDLLSDPSVEIIVNLTIPKAHVEVALRALDAGKQVIVEDSDGFAGLRALLPPPPRRGLVLIDPSYEEKQDYERVVQALKEALTRFPGGTYAVWYPQLTRIESRELPQRLKRLPGKGWLHVALRVREPARDGFGMHGSGMFVINPPWTLNDTLAGSMPFLVEALGEDAGAGFTLEQQAA